MILITGATGYIGRRLVARLIAHGESPRCLVRDRKRAANILPEANVELIEGATTRPASLLSALEGINTVVHAAFLTADRKQSAGNQYAATNVQGTANLVEAAQKAGVQRMIEMSGLGTKLDKPGSYMQGRYLAEKVLMESSLNWTIIRPSVLFGMGAPFISGLSNLIRTAPVLPLIGGGKIRFQPIYVEDVVTIILKILAEPESTAKQIYTIGGPEYYTFEQTLDVLLKTMGIFRPKLYAPMPLVGAGAAVMEAILPKPPITKAALTLFSFDNITDLKSVEHHFGFAPQPFGKYMEDHPQDL